MCPPVAERVSLSLSYVVLNTTDIQKTLACYEDVVGIELTEFMCFVPCSNSQCR